MVKHIRAEYPDLPVSSNEVMHEASLALKGNDEAYFRDLVQEGLLEYTDQSKNIDASIAEAFMKELIDHGKLDEFGEMINSLSNVNCKYYNGTYEGMMHAILNDAYQREAGTFIDCAMDYMKPVEDRRCQAIMSRRLEQKLNEALQDDDEVMFRERLQRLKEPICGISFKHLPSQWLFEKAVRLGSVKCALELWRFEPSVRGVDRYMLLADHCIKLRQVEFLASCEGLNDDQIDRIFWRALESPAKNRDLICLHMKKATQYGYLYSLLYYFSKDCEVIKLYLDNIQETWRTEEAVARVLDFAVEKYEGPMVDMLIERAGQGIPPTTETISLFSDILLSCKKHGSLFMEERYFSNSAPGSAASYASAYGFMKPQGIESRSYYLSYFLKNPSQEIPPESRSSFCWYLCVEKEKHHSEGEFLSNIHKDERIQRALSTAMIEASMKSWRIDEFSKLVSKEFAEKQNSPLPLLVKHLRNNNPKILARLMVEEGVSLFPEDDNIDQTRKDIVTLLPPDCILNCDSLLLHYKRFKSGNLGFFEKLINKISNFFERISEQDVKECVDQLHSVIAEQPKPVAQGGDALVLAQEAAKEIEQPKRQEDADVPTRLEEARVEQSLGQNVSNKR